MIWRTARGELSLSRPRVLGILNVTPDSFWDGGRYTGLDAALARAEALLGEGADAIDVGGESTRPGAAAVTADEEVRRVVPVIRELVRRWPDLLVSIDTVKAAVARAALDEGAAIVNDVSGLRLDPGLATVAREFSAGLILMHSRGTVETMASYELAVYGEDPVGEVAAELGACVSVATDAGAARESIVIDPGLGFAKRTEHSLALLAHLDRIVAMELPVLVGPSRKRFIGDASGGLPPEDRVEGTAAACVLAFVKGARLFRVHDVRPVRRAVAVAEAVRAVA